MPVDSDVQMRNLKNRRLCSRTLCRRMKKIEWDCQMRDLKRFDQVHVLAGDVWKYGMG